MSEYLKFKTESGDVFYVEVSPVVATRQDEGRQGPTKSANPVPQMMSNVAKEVRVSFEDALKTIKTQGEAVAKTIADFSQETAPDEVQMTFGLAVNAEVGFVVANANVIGGYAVTLIWRKPHTEPATVLQNNLIPIPQNPATQPSSVV